MSEYALLTGVQNYLRTFSNTFTQNNCGYQVSEKPPPMTADYHATIHMIDLRPGAYDDGGLIEEIYTFGVTITKRIKAVPEDRHPEGAYLNLTSGLSKLCRFVVAAIHHRSGPIITANTLLTDEDNADYLSVVAGEKFINVPTWVGTTAVPELRNEEWFHGTYNTRNDRTEPFGYIGMTKTVRFRVTKITQQKNNCS